MSKFTIVIDFDKILALNRWDIIARLFHNIPNELDVIYSFNKWLHSHNLPINANHYVDASKIVKKADYVICDINANKLEWLWSNDGLNSIEISCAQHHKCHCDRYLVFNQGCKCGGI
jgi:hypothetical protein